VSEKNGFDPELFFAALADRTRLRLLNLMRDGEVCVCFFAETLGTNNPKISRHLAYLKRASLVSGRRDGKWMHYRINEPSDKKAADVFEAMMEMLRPDKQMQADRARLVDVCCVPNAPVKIQGRRRPKGGTLNKR
jgi:ArsR family transcriptional regulator